MDSTRGVRLAGVSQRELQKKGKNMAISNNPVAELAGQLTVITYSLGAPRNLVWKAWVNSRALHALMGANRLHYHY